MKYVLSFILCFILFISAINAPIIVFEKYTQKIPASDQVIEMLPIKGGTFFMGSPTEEADRSVDESPRHEVQVDDFWMSKCEITWDVYRLFMERTIDAKQPAKVAGKEVNIKVDAVTGATTPYTEMSFGMGVDGFPATSMTQLAAARFCQWLSAMTGNFYRLPTEAEWEYACRAGSQTAYHFGDNVEDLSAYAWYEKNSNEAYYKVGRKKPNAWGLHDMHGNVAEWTLDQYNSKGYGRNVNEISNNPFTKPTKTYPKTVRGGSWKDSAEDLRSAARLPSSKRWKKRDPQIPKSLWWHTDAPFVGIRLVRPVKTPSVEEQKMYWGDNK